MIDVDNSCEPKKKEDSMAKATKKAKAIKKEMKAQRNKIAKQQGKLKKLKKAYKKLI
jgi:hypothetical protein